MWRNKQLSLIAILHSQEALLQSITGCQQYISVLNTNMHTYSFKQAKVNLVLKRVIIDATLLFIINMKTALLSLQACYTFFPYLHQIK